MKPPEMDISPFVMGQDLSVCPRDDLHLSFSNSISTLSMEINIKMRKDFNYCSLPKIIIFILLDFKIEHTGSLNLLSEV